ncbi:MAG: prepilin-type N-terminal cleavage/methylation domain-containing protein [Candidatus Moraniibacteriota bacterium]
MKKNGFTLIEVMMVMAFVAILAVLSSPFYGRFIFSQEVSVARDELRGSFAKAQTYSMTGKNDASWGVAFRDKKIILFQGNSFVERNQAFDESFVVHSRVALAGFDEVVFARTTGRPSIEPTITLSGNETTEILQMNSEGVVR